MAEHEHKIFHSGATEDPIVPVCSECGKDLMVLWQEAEQRVAEAQEALRIALAQRQDKQARLTEATALLFALSDHELFGYGAESSIKRCAVCGGDDEGNEYAPIEHAPDCDWLKARAFLGR